VSDVVAGLVTGPDREQLVRLGRALVEERLIACLNVVDRVTSVYRWEGEVCEEAEALGIPPEKCRGWMVRDDRFKYWRFNGMPDVLFDLERDPGELRNVAGDPRYADAVRDLRERLMDWRMSNEDVSRVAWTYARRPGFGREPFPV